MDNEELNNELFNEPQAEESANVESQEISEQPSQEATPQWNGNEYVLKYRGQEIIPESKEWMINQAQKGYAYDQATAAHSEEKKNYESQIQELNRYKQAIDNLQQNQSFMDWYNTQLNGGVEDTTNEQPVISPEYEERFSQMESQFKEYQASKEDEALEKETASLQAKYPDYNWDEEKTLGLYRFMQDNQMDNLEQAFKLMNYDNLVNKNKFDAMNQAKESIQDQNRKGIINGNGKSTVRQETTGYKPGMSDSDFSRGILADLNNIG